jgi:hypothetical protein
MSAGKKFYFNLDFEPDNVWTSPYSRTFKNLYGTQKLIDLAARYGVKVDLFLTYSSLQNDGVQRMIESWRSSYCNISFGIHPHLWELVNVEKGRSEAITVSSISKGDFEAAITRHIDAFKNVMGYHPEIHRSGRWGNSSWMLDVLQAHGIKVDSSVTPGINWERVGSHNYKNIDAHPMRSKTIHVIPISSSSIGRFPLSSFRYLSAPNIYRAVRNGYLWCRTNPRLSPSELNILFTYFADKYKFVNMMTHSSELIENGSPIWTSSNIESHFKLLESVFQIVKSEGYLPCSLGDIVET